MSHRKRTLAVVSDCVSQPVEHIYTDTIVDLTTQPQKRLKVKTTALTAQDGTTLDFTNKSLGHSEFFSEFFKNEYEDDDCVASMKTQVSGVILGHVRDFLEMIEDEEIFVPIDMSNSVMTLPINLTQPESDFLNRIEDLDMLTELLFAADFFMIEKLKNVVSQFFALKIKEASM